MLFRSSSPNVSQQLKQDGGGFVQMLALTVEVARSDYASEPAFHRGHAVTVTPNTGPARSGQIEAITDMGTLIQLVIMSTSRA